jgi:hypothetical protein
MLPDALDRTRALPRMFATMTRWHFLARDSTEVASSDGVIGGATLWDPPGRWQSTRLEEWLMMPTFIWAFRSRAAASREVAEAMKKNHSERAALVSDGHRHRPVRARRGPWHPPLTVAPKSDLMHAFRRFA